jgi:hypothetical protein
MRWQRCSATSGICGCAILHVVDTCILILVSSWCILSSRTPLQDGVSFIVCYGEFLPQGMRSWVLVLGCHVCERGIPAFGRVCVRPVGNDGYLLLYLYK